MPANPSAHEVGSTDCAPSRFTLHAGDSPYCVGDRNLSPPPNHAVPHTPQGYEDGMITKSMMGEQYVMVSKSVMGDQYVKDTGGSMGLKRVLGRAVITSTRSSRQ